MKKKILVIIAHPDDETIWMGGTLLKNKNNWNTAIISLCRKNDKDRAPKFRKACRVFRAKCFMSNLEDEKLNDIPADEVIRQIKKHANKNYDFIFTHGKNGEYGHKRHKDVNKAVIKMLKKGILSAKIIFFFSYKKKGKICYAKKNSDKFIKLGDNHFNAKRELIHKIYGFKMDSFEYSCCRKLEAFTTKGKI
ncbi:PIG-L family deacetylase [Candidatus Woesearchaeota archaeon]|nr:PIG-L family deacetylase [Candidatus Woesearchaeota archaeon]